MKQYKSGEFTMSEKRVSKQRISIYLSFLLRHHPEAAGITLDDMGGRMFPNCWKGSAKDILWGWIS